MNHLRDLETSKIFTEARILASTEDIPSTSFPIWANRVINLGKVVPVDDEFTPPNNLLQLVSELNSKLLEIGHYVKSSDLVRE
jgi:hypothetical protein